MEMLICGNIYIINFLSMEQYQVSLDGCGLFLVSHDRQGRYLPTVPVPTVLKSKFFSFCLQCSFFSTELIKLNGLRKT